MFQPCGCIFFEGTPFWSGFEGTQQQETHHLHGSLFDFGRFSWREEFPPWKDVRAEHAERGHKWMEKCLGLISADPRMAHLGKPVKRDSSKRKRKGENIRSSRISRQTWLTHRVVKTTEEGEHGETCTSTVILRDATKQDWGWDLSFDTCMLRGCFKFGHWTQAALPFFGVEDPFGGFPLGSPHGKSVGSDAKTQKQERAMRPMAPRLSGVNPSWPRRIHVRVCIFAKTSTSFLPDSIGLKATSWPYTLPASDQEEKHPLFVFFDK